MKNKAWLTAACMILLCGCAHLEESTPQTAESSVAQTATVPVVVPKETDAPPENTPSAPVVPEQTPDEVLESYAANDPQSFQGGIGGEEHANTPLPEYFNYRFVAESVTMRLAGGNYQAISYDFSETVAHNAYYYLNDYNNDGYFDLYAPVKYDGERIITCAVFLWNPETGKFTETPILYNEPELPASANDFEEDSDED